jgi:hypothetical protein
MDTFSGLVIYVSLRALARNPTPWHVLNTGENLLFRREDFQPPFDTAAWTHLSGLGDRQVDDLARRLIECCVPGWSASGSLGDLVTPRAMPWWERTQLATAGAPTRAFPAAAPTTPPQWPANGGRPPTAPTAPAPRQPGANWWREQPVRRPAGSPARIAAVALTIGIAVSLLVMAVGEFDEDAVGPGILIGFVLAAITTAVGFARRK